MGKHILIGVVIGAVAAFLLRKQNVGRNQTTVQLANQIGSM